MKVTLLGRSIILMIALLFVVGSISPASSAPEARIWVEYQMGQQANVRASLQQAGAKFHYQFENLNSFVVSLPENALNGIRRNPNVVSIEEDPVRELVRNMPADVESVLAADAIIPGEQVVPYGIDMVQARDVWDKNRDGVIDKKAITGKDMQVCIIDTGFYSRHEDFMGVDVVGGISQVDDNWENDGYGHGTHVAGTIVAQNNSYGVVGVTPGTASLYIVKIFDDTGAWVSKAHASDLVAAAFECADKGSDIISMSLSGTQKTGKEERAFNQLYEEGVLSIAAASNEGIEEYHYPASYDSVISVAAIDADMVVAEFSQFNDQVELAAPGVGVLSTLPYINISTVTVAGNIYNGNHVEFTPFAPDGVSGLLADGELCTATGDWAGKVVLCQRGEISFYDKVMNVQNSGGVAAIIYNNLDEDLFATLGEGNTSEIPAIGLSQDQGLELFANYLGSETTVTTAIDFPASGYEAWNGTSMATPHVSGVAALIWSANPDWTNDQVREAMAMTALDLGDEGRDVYYGYGLVQAKDALQYLKKTFR